MIKIQVYKSTKFYLLTVFGVEQSIILREGHLLRVFKSGVLRGMFVSKREKVTHHLAQNSDRWRGLNRVMKLRVSVKSGNILTNF